MARSSRVTLSGGYSPVTASPAPRRRRHAPSLAAVVVAPTRDPTGFEHPSWHWVHFIHFIASRGVETSEGGVAFRFVAKRTRARKRPTEGDTAHEGAEHRAGRSQGRCGRVAQDIAHQAVRSMFHWEPTEASTSSASSTGSEPGRHHTLTFTSSHDGPRRASTPHMTRSAPTTGTRSLRTVHETPARPPRRVRGARCAPAALEAPTADGSPSTGRVGRDREEKAEVLPGLRSAMAPLGTATLRARPYTARPAFTPSAIFDYGELRTQAGEVPA